MKISEAIKQLQLMYTIHGDIELKHPIDWEIEFDEINKLETWEEKDELICYFSG